MLEKAAHGRTMVFIDAANLESSVKALGWWINYKKLYKYLKKRTLLIDARHYCPVLGDRQQDDFLRVLKGIGYTLVTKPVKSIEPDDAAKGRQHKANFDVELALDALDLSARYDTMVLFSRDSDFGYLLELLRKKGKIVIIIASRHNASRELIRLCHHFIDIAAIRPYIERTGKKENATTNGGE